MANQTTDIYTPYAFETFTVSSTALPLNSSVYATGAAEPVLARITSATAEVRVRLDGGTPTGGVGHLIAVNTSMDVYGAAAIRNLKAIRASIDAVISVTYFKREN